MKPNIVQMNNANNEQYVVPLILNEGMTSLLAPTITKLFELS